MCIRDILFIITEFLGFVKKFAGNGDIIGVYGKIIFFHLHFAGDVV